MRIADETLEDAYQIADADEPEYKMPYSELDDIRAFVRRHEWEEIPESIKDYLEKWDEWLYENF